MREQLDAWVDAHRNEIISETQAILQIPSVEDPATAKPGIPFGQAIGDALRHTLNVCERAGMKTEDFEGYAGHAEFGEGEEIVAMLGHLDVVPPGTGWTTGPWEADIRDGWLFARGASDDKGPTYAALFGARAVLETTQNAGVKLSRRIRLIFGCDEESGWQCMAHYFGPAGQPKPNLAFTPDADFPLVYAEKGSFTAVVRKIIPHTPNAPLYIASFMSGLRPNMVPESAEAMLHGDAGTLELAAHVLAEMPGVSVEPNDNALIVRATGKSAHGATPEMGDNAAAKLCRALTNQTSALDDLSASDAEWTRDLARRVAPDGSGVGIAGSDDVTGPLTSNLGVVTCENGTVRATFNIRYPATWDGDDVTGRFRNSLSETGWEIETLSHTPPLYVPPDQEPVQTLLRVYREQTGDLRPPVTMGGRTYATSVAPVGVAFGPSMPGDPEVAHQKDERIAIERLIGCAKIYAQALYELAK